MRLIFQNHNFFFFNAPPTPEISPLPLHDALPICGARAAVAATADLLLTSAPAALDYGRTRSEYQDAPLGWDQTYVLLAPDGSSLELSALRLETLPQAVHVEARPAQGDDGGVWLVGPQRCGLRAQAPTTHATPQRL